MWKPCMGETPKRMDAFTALQLHLYSWMCRDCQVIVLSLDLIAELVKQYGVNNLSMFFLVHWETIYVYVVLAYTADTSDVSSSSD